MKSNYPLRSTRRFVRRGISALWVIILTPCLVVALCLVIEVANLWIARAELETAVEAAALAGVKSFREDLVTPNDTQDDRNVAVDYFESNDVRRQNVNNDANFMLDPNYNGANTNGNNNVNGELVFGAIISASGANPHVFDPNTEPDCTLGNDLPHAVRARKTLRINSVCGNLFGITTTGFDVQAEAYAFYGCGAGSPQLIRVGP